MTIIKRTALALLVSLAAVSAAAAAQPQACLRNNNIDSFSSIRGDQRSIIVIDRLRARYKVSFNTICDSVDFNMSLTIRSRAGFGLSCVTRGDEVVTRGIDGHRERCVITSVQPYTAALERADRARAAAR